MKNINNKKKKTFALFFDTLKENKLYLTMFILVFILGNILEFVATFKFAELLEVVTIGDINSVTYLFGMITLFICIGYGTNILANIFTYKIATKSGDKVRSQLIDRLFVISAQSYSNVKTGKMISRVSFGARNMMMSFLDILTTVLYSFTSINIIVYIFTQSILLGVLLLVICLLIIIVILLYNKIGYSKLLKIQYDKADGVNSVVNEMVRSEKDIKALNLENEIDKMASIKFKENAEADRNIDLSSGIFYRVLKICISVAVLALSLYAFFALEQNAITITLFMLFWGNVFSITDQAISSSELFQNFHRFKTYCEKVNEIFDTEVYKLESFGNENFDEDFKGNITFKNVCFAYDDEKDKNVIDEMSFEIQSGKSVAFVGTSGSGKSTLISLISKLYDATNGEILLDNKNIKDLNKNAIRENLALVNQFPYIFDASIKENLQLVNAKATEEDMWNVLKMADLKTFVQNLPNKLDTILGENGIKLSGGQKQRLAIARAFLKQSKVIIFDESTSSLDNFAQGVVQKSIETLHGKKTVIIVAHRLSTIKNVDTIFFIEKGKVRCQGGFEQLFKNDEKFKSLFMAENIEEQQ